MAPTTSRWQLRRREAGWEGSRRRNRDPRNTNRIEGGAVRASQHDVAKPDVIKGPSRKRGGCARKVAGLIRGDLHGCRKMLDRCLGADRRVGCDGEGREVVARRGEVSRGRSTGGIDGRREGPNAKPSRRTFVLVVVALTAANPSEGPGREGPRVKPEDPRPERSSDPAPDDTAAHPAEAGSVGAGLVPREPRRGAQTRRAERRCRRHRRDEHQGAAAVVEGPLAADPLAA